MSKKSEEILALYKSKVMPTYAPSVVIASGKGVTVRDVDGRTYYDFTSAIRSRRPASDFPASANACSASANLSSR